MRIFVLCQGRRVLGGGSIFKHIRPSHGASLTRAEGKKTINQCFPRCLAIVCSVYNRHSTMCSFRVRRIVLSDKPDSATRARIVIFLSAIIFLTLLVIMRQPFCRRVQLFSYNEFRSREKESQSASLILVFLTTAGSCGFLSQGDSYPPFHERLPSRQYGFFASIG